MYSLQFVGLGVLLLIVLGWVTYRSVNRGAKAHGGLEATATDRAKGRRVSGEDD